MYDVIDAVATGRWFKEPAPFRCIVQKAHPKLCVITGPNMAGKSLLRKVIHNQYHDRQMEYISVSQEQRCSSTGLQRLMVYGTETDESTGYNSIKMLLKAFQTGQAREKPFAVMLDEPEIGCGEEVQAAIGLRIAREINTMPNLHGLYIVTQSREMVRSLLQGLKAEDKVQPTHWRLSEDGITLEDWTTRVVVPCDLEALLALGKENWHAVSAITNKC